MRLVARDFHKARTGVSAEVNILVDQTLLAYDTFNLSKLDERTRLAKSAHSHFKNGLAEIYPQEALKHDVDLFCRIARHKWEESPAVQGQPIAPLRLDEPGTAPEWLLKPLIHRGQPSLLFADGGTGKSFLGLAIAIIAARGWAANPLKLGIAKPIPTLYLDWETNREEVHWRLKAMAKGMEVPAGQDIQYRECRRPFHEDVGPIAQVVTEKAIRLIILDSIGGACGGDLKENEAANLYFGAMRTLGVASLSLTHITKAERDSKEATAFGSRYFHNWARSEWELRQSQDESEDSITAGLFHRKANNTKRHPPIGIRLDFFNDDDVLRELTFTRIDLRSHPVLSQNLTTGVRIKEALKAGCMTPEKLLKVLGVKDGTLRTELSRLNKKGEIQKIGDSWALPYIPREET